jgi:hypothetical protein
MNNNARQLTHLSRQKNLKLPKVLRKPVRCGNLETRLYASLPSNHSTSAAMHSRPSCLQRSGSGKTDDARRVALSALLPHAFGPGHLG